MHGSGAERRRAVSREAEIDMSGEGQAIRCAARRRMQRIEPAVVGTGGGDRLRAALRAAVLAVYARRMGGTMMPLPQARRVARRALLEPPAVPAQDARRAIAALECFYRRVQPFTEDDTLFVRQASWPVDPDGDVRGYFDRAAETAHGLTLHWYGARLPSECHHRAPSTPAADDGALLVPAWVPVRGRPACVAAMCVDGRSATRRSGSREVLDQAGLAALIFHDLLRGIEQRIHFSRHTRTGPGRHAQAGLTPYEDRESAGEGR